jgi:hypothetical protein
VNEKEERLLFFFFVVGVDVCVVKVGKEGGSLLSNGFDNRTAMGFDSLRLQPLPELLVVQVGTRALCPEHEVLAKELVGVVDLFALATTFVERQHFGSFRADTGDFGNVSRDGNGVPFLRRAVGDFGLAGIVTFFGSLEKEQQRQREGRASCEYSYS